MKKHNLKEWIIALRPWSFPASAMPIVVTLAYIYWTGAQMNWLLGLWALVGMILFHCTGNVWSDYFDFKKKVDAEDTFGAKTLTTGMFKPEEIRNLAIGFLVVSVACGLGLFAVTGMPLLWIGIAGVACTLLYPVLKFNALGDLDIIMAFAFLPTLGTSYVATGAIDWNVLFVALPVGLITDAILHSNNSRDVVTDKRAGITTMAMRMGAKWSVRLFGFEMIFPYVWVGILSMIGLLPVYTVAIFLTLPVAIGNAGTMKKSLKAGVGIIADLDVKTANLQLMFSVLLTAALVVAKFI